MTLKKKTNTGRDARGNVAYTSSVDRRLCFPTRSREHLNWALRLFIGGPLCCVVTAASYYA